MGLLDDKNALQNLVDSQRQKTTALAKKEPFTGIKLYYADANNTPSKEELEGSTQQRLSKSILKFLNGNSDNPNTLSRLAFESDPDEKTLVGGLYEMKLRLLPDDILKRIAIQDDLVACIVNVRSNMLAAFGRPQPDPYSTGYKIIPQPGILDNIKDEEKKKRFLEDIKEAERRIAMCGGEVGFDAREKHMHFSQYLKMSTRDAIIVGRVATEMLFSNEADTGKRKFKAFRPIDGGTIYKATKRSQDELATVRESAQTILNEIHGHKSEATQDPEKEYDWVQVIEGRVRQTFTDQQCALHNFYPVTDVKMNGYPVTPLDTIINAVTTHINISEYNKLYFSSGRGTKGMLVIQSEAVDDTTLMQIKQEFNASINSVQNAHRSPVFACAPGDTVQWVQMDSARDMEFQFLSDSNARSILAAFQISPDEVPAMSHLSRGTNASSLSECLSLDSSIYTSKGYLEIGSLLKDNQETFASIWDGNKWTEGRIFKSGIKHLMATTVESGLQLKTSPDHRFRTLDNNGNVVWKHQSELQVGDWVAINSKVVKGVDDVPTYNGKKLTPEMMEILGWLTGDGNIVSPKVRSGGQLHFFYHHEKEIDVWDRHFLTLSEFGVNVKQVKKELTEEARAKIAARYGFKSVAATRYKNTCYDTKFVNWLLALGFTPSRDGKKIPNAVYTLPVEYRQAFLRGFFSADGGKLNDTGTVNITIQNNELREQTRALLIGLGIRTTAGKGVLRESFGEKAFSYKLTIKDRAAFWSQIGFVQDHKQLNGACPQKWSINDLPKSLRIKYLKQCRQSANYNSLSKPIKDQIVSGIKEDGRNCSLRFLINFLEICGLSIPSELTDFHFEKISILEDLKQDVEMADVEMFSDSHMFVANGFIVHNSDNEYKLVAARDVGLRPLMSGFEDFINMRILPVIAPKLAKVCVFKFLGLDALDEEKASIRIKEDMSVDMTYDEVLGRKEKKPIGKDVGGEYPLNPQIQAIIEKYLTKGQILEKFFAVKDASKDPRWNYCIQDPISSQMFLAKGQMDLQLEGQKQAAASQPPPQQGGAPQSEQPQAQVNPDDVNQLKQQLTQVISALSKSEEQLTDSAKDLYKKQTQLVDSTINEWEKEAQELKKQALKLVKQLSPKKK